LPDPADQMYRDRDRPRGLPVVCLPAGEAMLIPAPNSAEGKLVVDTFTHRGRDITGLTLTFKAGKITALNARSGADYLRPLYDAAGPGKDLLSSIDTGLTPEVRLPDGVKPAAPMPLGMVSIAIGNNTRAGGENSSPFALLLSLPGSTLTVGETTLVD